MEIANHLIYVAMSIAFTVFLGQSLFNHGRHFLLECLANEKTAEAVNRFLLNGFYLTNLAFVLVILKYGATGDSIERSLELISRRVGFVALIMGGLHFNNLFWCEFVRRKRNRSPIPMPSAQDTIRW